MRRLRLLQIFSKYLEYGGEEYIAGRIEDALADRHEMFRYVGSSRKLFEGGLAGRALLPWRTIYNHSVAQDLRKEQQRNRHDLWVIHNVFPALSPSVYMVAKELNVPIVHYLHNYRLSCANGYFLNHGQACQRCAQGNFLPALATGCWRESRIISGWMGVVLQKIRRDDVFRQIRCWITPSVNQKNIHVRMGLPANRLEVVPYYLEADPSVPQSCPQGNVLFIGRLSPEKGVDRLLQAWALLPAGNRHLWIAGTGPEETRLKKMATDLKLLNVRWLGFVPRQNQDALWAQTAFSVIPSIWHEPYPLSFMEAWKHGRPFIGSRLGAMAEVLADGKGGLLADPDSPEDLARQIGSFLQNPRQVIEAGAEGHAKLLEENNKKLWLERFEKVLEKSLNPRTEASGPPKETPETFYACTLFDSGFLAKGLALLASLKRQGLPFRLHVFAMDDFTADYLEGLQDACVVVIRHQDFEDSQLLQVKGGRTRAEYYWTCGSSTLLYCLEKLGLPRCTYLDADVCFYGPAQKLESQMGEDSIGITPHNYAAAYDQNRTHGVYCVQYVTIRNDARGLRAVRWWREQCLAWCYGRIEKGRFGDQKYLDDWPERFDGVRVLDAPGIGLAPWNCRDYEILPNGDRGWTCRDRSNRREAPLIFFHFHELKFFPHDQLKLVGGGYEIPPVVAKELYRPYIRELLQTAGEINRKHPSANPLAVAPPDSWKWLGAKIYSRLNPRFYDHYISLRKALSD